MITIRVTLTHHPEHKLFAVTTERAVFEGKPYDTRVEFTYKGQPSVSAVFKQAMAYERGVVDAAKMIGVICENPSSIAIGAEALELDRENPAANLSLIVGVLKSVLAQWENPEDMRLNPHLAESDVVDSIRIVLGALE